MSSSSTTPLSYTPAGGTVQSRATGFDCRIIDGKPYKPPTALQNLQASRFQSSDCDSDPTPIFREPQHHLRSQTPELHDPVNKLPPELRCEIFRRVSMSPCESEDAERKIPVTAVCKSWRETIIADPIFWTTIHIPYVADRFGLEEIEVWLSRSTKLPLSIVFSDRHLYGSSVLPVEACEDLQDALWAQKHRIRAVEGTFSKWFVQKMLKEPVMPDTAWPMLTSILIREVAEPHIPEVAELLRRCPHVQCLKLRTDSTRKESEAEMPPITLRHLKTLNLRFSGYACFPGLLANLVTPALWEVRYRYIYGGISRSSSTLEALFRRSACAITTLHIGYGIFVRNSFVSLLKSLPSLRNLTTELTPCYRPPEIEIDTSMACFGAVLQLLVSDWDFLPNLEVLKHSGCMLYPWDDLVDVYSVHNQVLDEYPLELNSEQTGSGPKVPSKTCRPLHLLRFLINDYVRHGEEQRDPERPMVYDDMVVLNPLREVHVRRLTARVSNTKLRGVCSFECGCDIGLLQTMP